MWQWAANMVYWQNTRYLDTFWETGECADWPIRSRYQVCNDGPAVSYHSPYLVLIKSKPAFSVLQTGKKSVQCSVISRSAPLSTDRTDLCHAASLDHQVCLAWRKLAVGRLLGECYQGGTVKSHLLLIYWRLPALSGHCFSSISHPSSHLLLTC